MGGRGKGKEGRGGDVERPGKWSAQGPALALGGPAGNNVKFPDGSRHSSMALGMLSVTHIMPILVLNTCMGTNMHMQLTVNSFRQLFL